jgi:hypothetical protein
MVFGAGSYFGGIDVSDAAAHGFTAGHLGEIATFDLRNVISAPCDLAQRAGTWLSARPPSGTTEQREGDVPAAPPWPHHRRPGTAT